MTAPVEQLTVSRVARGSRRRSVRSASEWAWLIAPFLVGLALRLPGLHGQVLGGDELHALRAALSMPLAAILTTYQSTDNCIPLTVLYWVMTKFTRLDEPLLRAPILVFGALLPLVVPLVIRREAGKPAAHILAWLLALSPELVMYSTIARPYAPIVLLAFAAVMSFYVWMERRSWEWGGAYVALAALAMYFHLVAGLFVVSPFLFAGGALLIDGEERRTMGFLLLLAGALVLMAAIFMVPARDSLIQLIAAKHSRITVGFETLIGAARLTSGTARLPVVAGFATLAALGIIRLFRRRRRLAVYTLTLTIAQLVGLVILSPVGVEEPQIFSRYVLVAVPFILLWVAVALSEPWWPRQSAAGRRAQRSLAYGFLLLLFFSGPLADREFWSSGFRHHRDFVMFHRARGTMRLEDVPNFYRTLGRDGAPTPIIEFPWSASWKFARIFYVYQQVHRQEVIVSTPEPLLDHARLTLALMVPPSTEAFLASRARYLVVHRDPGAEEVRIRGRHRYWKEPPFREHYAELRKAGGGMAAALETEWGRPAYADDAICVWDLQLIRAKVQSQPIGRS